jgi:pyruvate-ferredoxin/flavodoxin oxidoreductase
MTLRSTGEKVRYTVAHYEVTEARFRQHIREGRPGEGVHDRDPRRPPDPSEAGRRRPPRVFDLQVPAYVPDFGHAIKADYHERRPLLHALSRQMVLLWAKPRKVCRLLQSKARIDNKKYWAEQALLARLPKGEIGGDDLLKGGPMLLKEQA